MPIVSDFVTIINNKEQLITARERDFPFGTGGRSKGSAFIIFNIRNLRETLPVKVNGREIGTLNKYPRDNDFQLTPWFTQIITFSGSLLRDGNNELELESSKTDNYFVKDVQCFFHQNA